MNSARQTWILVLAMLLGLSIAVYCASIPQAKLLGEGSTVTLPAKIVTYTGTDYFYIQEANSGVSLTSAPVGGIRVSKSAHGLALGARVNVIGTMRTNASSERYVECSSATNASGSGSVRPWAMSNRSVSEDDSTGLLVRSTGFVVYVDPAGTFAYVDDGSSLNDGNTAGPLGSNLTGLRINIPASVTAPKMTQHVTVTGVASLELVSGAPARVVLAQAVSRDDPGTLMPDMNMLCVPGGQFLMGNSGVGYDAAFGRPCEHPQHAVDVPTFWISKYEVTRGQFNQFILAGGYSNPSYWSGEGWSWKLSISRSGPDYWTNPAIWQERGMPHIAVGSFTQTDSHPVTGVSYYEAEAFCRWAGGRLPAEAEWEKAARWDGSPRIYPWGGSTDKTRLNDWYDTSYMGWQTAPVTAYSSSTSPYGCLGMAGNVWEWTQDWYKSYPGSADPFDKTNVARSVRGGGWYGVYGDRCASRWFAPPASINNDVGFRLAR